MKIHIVSTINGIKNEGMRNVATNLAEAFEKKHKVFYSKINDLFNIVCNCIKSDVTILFARCNAKTYLMVKIIETLCKNAWVVVVQKPEENYIAKNNNRPLKCNYLTLDNDDISQVRLAKGKKAICFNIGIDSTKFSCVDKNRRQELKKKYGFKSNIPLVVHVGHCSSGRGLEDFMQLDANEFERLIVTSGMFNDDEKEALLKENGVKIMSGYIENINEIYQMADAYLFPTKSGEYVISVPLSVLEAVACGTPAVGYKSYKKFASVSKLTDVGGVFYIEDYKNLPQAVKNATVYKRTNSLLKNIENWQQVAEGILEIL